MKAILLLSLGLGFALRVIAQSPSSLITSASASAPTSVISQTPEMASSSVSSVFAALATATPLQPNDLAPGADNGGGSASDQNAAGAAGSDSGSLNLSKGGMIAIIVVVVVVAIFGIVSSVLFYLAKKRSWEVRATIRRSAKRVATALTPRRSAFPKNVMDPKRASSRGMSRMDEVPPTPRLKREDLEKGVKMAEFEMSEPPTKSTKWGRKTDR